MTKWKKIVSYLQILLRAKCGFQSIDMLTGMKKGGKYFQLEPYQYNWLYKGRSYLINKRSWISL